MGGTLKRIWRGPEEFAAQVGALSVAMKATAEANAQKVYTGEDTALPARAAAPNQGNGTLSAMPR